VASLLHRSFSYVPGNYRSPNNAGKATAIHWWHHYMVSIYTNNHEVLWNTINLEVLAHTVHLSWYVKLSYMSDMQCMLECRYNVLETIVYSENKSPSTKPACVRFKAVTISTTVNVVFKCPYSDFICIVLATCEWYSMHIYSIILYILLQWAWINHCCNRT